MATSKLQENLSKYFYSGIGLAAHTADVVQKGVDEFVKHGKLNEAEGKKIVGDAMKKVEAQRSTIEARYNEALHKLVHLSAQEVSKLQKRIEHLEKRGTTKSNGVNAASKTVVKDIKKAASKGKKIVTKAKKMAA
jgi:polyhydroxyalkanoate synthesis regulator phasin